MARIRTIKPEFCTSEQVVECSPTARLLFVLMWTHCDDQGVHPDSAKQLKMRCFPADDFTTADMERFVDELVSVGLLARFEAEGQRFLYVTGWKRHQKIDKPTRKYPAPPADFDEASAQPSAPLDEPSPTTRRALDPGYRYRREGKGYRYRIPPTVPPFVRRAIAGCGFGLEGSEPSRHSPTAKRRGCSSGQLMADCWP